MKKFKVTYSTDKVETDEVRANRFEMVNSDESAQFFDEEDNIIAFYNHVIKVVFVK